MNIDLGNKYIHAKPTDNINGKAAWAIVNTKSGSEIACVGWYREWNRYVMLTDTSAVFDIGCLQSIIKFIDGI